MPLFLKSGLILLMFIAFSAKAQTTNETFINGAYIIDMGQSSQTVAKGLKPYGLVYTLIKDHNVPVRWAINPSKLKDGTDFTVNSKNYKGGTFIIPAQYINTAVLTKINTWKSAGVVVDGPINTTFTAPIYKELTSWPRAVLDEDNGKIVKDYYSNAGIPTSSYTLGGNPTELTGCDDIYVLPHADPQNWSTTWKTALDNYIKSGGYLWAACHAVSALEANTPTYLGFKYLSTNGLTPWGNHNDGNGNYTYNPAYASDPIMQFMGTLDAATTNGSEQIYIPYKGASNWRPTTSVAVYQPSHSQADANEAAVVVYGPAYGNSNYGMVMYEAGHDHAKKSDPENIAAQRAYFNFILMSGIQKQPEVTTNIPSTVYSGEVLNLSATVVGGTGPYSYAWSSSCTGGSFTNPNSANATYTAPVVNAITDCIITVIVTDNCGRFSIASETVVVLPPQADLMVVKTVNNPAPAVGSNVSFTITATNNGQNNATGVKIIDVLPSGYTFVSASASTGVWSAPNWTIGNFANGASATLTIVATVKSTGNYANTATISGNQTDPTPGNNSSTSTPVPVATADLAITKTVNNQTPNVGSNVTFLITATNNGPSNATGVTVNDVLPAGYTLVSATPSIGSWSAPNWTIGNLASSGNATLSIVATVKASGSYANTATISGNQTDPTPGNNSATSTPVPVSIADLAVTKTVNNQTPNMGSNVTFTIAATNNGPSAATGVTVNDVLPAGYTFVSASASTGTWTAPNWAIGNLAIGASANLTIVATVNATGSYANTATISGNQSDPVPANNSSTVTPVPTAVADLAVLKTVSNQTPTVGSNVSFTITATNNGPSTATGINVNDVLPAGYTFVSASASVGSWSAPNWSIASLSNGANATLTIVATVNTTGSYANTATITGTQPDPNSGNNTSTVTPIPSAVADLAVTKTVNNQTPSIGTDVTFTISATNNGPSAATGVIVNDVLPAGYTFVSASASNGSWSAPNWNIGNFANNANATLTIVATVNASGLYANTATISGNQSDPVPANNSSTVTPVPSAVADLAVLKTVSNQTPTVGSNVNFTITATNNGPSTATGIIVNDVLPAGYTFVSASASVGSWSAPNWNIASLSNGASATLTIVATVKAAGPYANTATITGTQPDPNSGNNTSTVTPVPAASADLAVNKTVSDPTPNVGTNVTFTITATNNGPSNATGVSVNDVLPAGYTFVSATPSSGTWSAPNWTIGNLANGASTTMNIVATVKASGPYQNTAIISGNEPDPTQANNTSSVSPQVGSLADLAVTKTISNQTPNVGTNVTFTITATNNGPSPATGAIVTDILPAGYTFVSATPSSGTWSAPNWTIGNLANGASATMNIVATVNATGPYPNTASITGNESDPNLNNNSATVTPQIGAVTDLAVLKTVNVQNPMVGNNITFTITASNNGPSAASGVSVNDVLPAGYAFVSANTANGSWTAPNWTIGSLAAGGSAILTMIVTVNTGGPYANTAIISGNESDSNQNNNTSTSTPVPGPDAINDNATTNLNTSVDITVLGNDVTGAAALNPGSVTFVAGTIPPATEGVFTVNPTTGVVTFTPTTGFTGTSTVNYQVCDLNALCDAATITVIINAVAGPTANDDNATTNLNTPVDINVLTNDVAGATPLNPTSVTFVAGTAPNPTTQGTFTVNGTTGLVTFTPVNGFTGTVTIDYKVCDQNALCDEAKITVVINSVAGPTANDDNATTNLNTPVDINVLANDVAGATTIDPTTVALIAGTTPNPATEGTFTVNPVTGLVTFTPVNGFTGTVTADYKVCDQNALCDEATITVVINSVAGPDAVNDNATTLINTPVNIEVLLNDLPGAAAINTASVTFTVGSEPNPTTVGTFTVNATTGIVTFTPVNGFIGTATIEYQVCDLNSLCDVATITVIIIQGTSNLYPALGYGTLAYEDLWPGKGDYDFNDLVLDYQFEIISNESNMIESVKGTFVIKAFGASFENGFGFQLSSVIDPADLTVTGYELSENIITLEANGVEAGQTKPTIIVYDNAFAQMPHPGIGIGVNTEPSAPYVTPVTLTINIVFKPNTYSFNDLDISNFNPFLIINKNRTMEVHLPNYPPTALADMSVFGTFEDNSVPSTGRYYVTDTNLPWAINIYEKFDYPIEKQEILWAHLKFAEWAMSGGVQFPDWYKNLTGYRNASLIYQVPAKK